MAARLRTQGTRWRDTALDRVRRFAGGSHSMGSPERSQSTGWRRPRLLWIWCSPRSAIAQGRPGVPPALVTGPVR